jgi:hypothetical protein
LTPTKACSHLGMVADGGPCGEDLNWVLLAVSNGWHDE